MKEVRVEVVGWVGVVGCSLSVQPKPKSQHHTPSSWGVGVKVKVCREIGIIWIKNM